MLTKILNPFDEAADSFIFNAKHLKDELKKIKLDEDCFMGSYDVRNLYPSVPIKETLKITKTLLQKDKTLKQRTSWSIDHIMIFLEICLETHFKSLNGTIYTKTDGTPIGKSISGPIAGIYLRWFEDTFVKSHKYNMQIVLLEKAKR